MEFLSQELGLETRSISNWFHNHRMRLKQNLPQGMDNLALLAAGGRNPEGSPSGPGKNTDLYRKFSINSRPIMQVYSIRSWVIKVRNPLDFIKLLFLGLYWNHL